MFVYKIPSLCCSIHERKQKFDRIGVWMSLAMFAWAAMQWNVLWFFVVDMANGVHLIVASAIYSVNCTLINIHRQENLIVYFSLSVHIKNSNKNITKISRTHSYRYNHTRNSLSIHIGRFFFFGGYVFFSIPNHFKSTHRILIFTIWFSDSKTLVDTHPNFGVLLVFSTKFHSNWRQTIDAKVKKKLCCFLLVRICFDVCVCTPSIYLFHTLA